MVRRDLADFGSMTVRFAIDASQRAWTRTSLALEVYIRPSESERLPATHACVNQELEEQPIPRVARPIEERMNLDGFEEPRLDREMRGRRTAATGFLAILPSRTAASPR